MQKILKILRKTFKTSFFKHFKIFEKKRFKAFLKRFKITL